MIYGYTYRTVNFFAIMFHSILMKLRITIQHQIQEFKCNSEINVIIVYFACFTFLITLHIKFTLHAVKQKSNSENNPINALPLKSLYIILPKDSLTSSEHQGENTGSLCSEIQHTSHPTTTGMLQTFLFHVICGAL